MHDKYEIHIFRAVIPVDQLYTAYSVTDEEVRTFYPSQLADIVMDQHSLMFYQAAVISVNHHTNHRSKFQFISF